MDGEDLIEYVKNVHKLMLKTLPKSRGHIVIVFDTEKSETLDHIPLVYLSSENSLISLEILSIILDMEMEKEIKKRDPEEFH